MPIYDFKCDECSTTIEFLVSFDERDKQVCEDCDKPLKRLISMPNLAGFDNLGRSN